MITTKDLPSEILSNKTYYTRKLGNKYHLLIKEPCYENRNKCSGDFISKTDYEIRYFSSEKPFEIPKHTSDDRSFLLNLEDSLSKKVNYHGKKTEKKSNEEIHFSDGIRKKKVNNHWKTWYCKGLIYEGELKTPIEFFINFFAKNKFKNNELISERLGIPNRIEKEISEVIKSKMKEHLSNINKAMKVCKFK